MTGKRIVYVIFSLPADDDDESFGLTQERRELVEEAITKIGGSEIGYEVTVEEE